MEIDKDQRLRLAVIGCGAVARAYHLPAARQSELVDVVALVDRETDRARDLAAEFGVPTVLSDASELPDDIDAVINALPHNLHAPMSIEFLRRGISVLCEKPMALNVAEGEAMVAAAEEGGATLAIALVRRFFDSGNLAKWIVGQGMLGPLVSAEFEEGGEYTWPVASGFFWDRARAGGGVLIDTGAHVLDQLIWWLGDPVDVSYEDDSLGGVEANCRLALALPQGDSTFPVTVTLSRTHALANRAYIVGTDASLVVDSADTVGVNLYRNPEGMDEGVHADWTCGVEETISPISSEPPVIQNYFDLQLDDFATALIDRREPRASGAEALRSVKLIDSCYAHRKDMVLPWVSMADSREANHE